MYQLLKSALVAALTVSSGLMFSLAARAGCNTYPIDQGDYTVTYNTCTIDYDIIPWHCTGSCYAAKHSLGSTCGNSTTPTGADCTLKTASVPTYTGNMPCVTFDSICLCDGPTSQGNRFTWAAGSNVTVPSCACTACTY